MKPNEMHNLAHSGCHQCAPKGWRDVPLVTGDYDMDATILHRRNKALPSRLGLYTKTRVTAYSQYGYKSAYNGIPKLAGGS